MWHKGINYEDCCALRSNPLKVALPAAAGEPMRGGWELYNLQPSGWKRNRLGGISWKIITTALYGCCQDSVGEIWANCCHQGHCLNTGGVSLPDWQLINAWIEAGIASVSVNLFYESFQRNLYQYFISSTRKPRITPHPGSWIMLKVGKTPWHL